EADRILAELQIVDSTEIAGVVDEIGTDLDDDDDDKQEEESDNDISQTMFTLFVMVFLVLEAIFIYFMIQHGALARFFNRSSIDYLQHCALMLLSSSGVYR
ncbi:MAG: hypothetical protein FWD45_06295, partial [Coriobacteriia bacterium]|nr:hypothetical protein [Coriobacteriia bacterium]